MTTVGSSLVFPRSGPLRARIWLAKAPGIGLSLPNTSLLNPGLQAATLTVRGDQANRRDAITERRWFWASRRHESHAPMSKIARAFERSPSSSRSRRVPTLDRPGQGPTPYRVFISHSSARDLYRQ